MDIITVSQFTPVPTLPGLPYAACRVDFTPEFEVNASTDTQWSINPTYKKLY